MVEYGVPDQDMGKGWVPCARHQHLVLDAHAALSPTGGVLKVGGTVKEKMGSRSEAPAEAQILQIAQNSLEKTAF